jgi:hypothetical protein
MTAVLPNDGDIDMSASEDSSGDSPEDEEDEEEEEYNEGEDEYNNEDEEYNEEEYNEVREKVVIRLDSRLSLII